MLKRIVSLVLTLVLLVTPCLQVLSAAEGFNLPSSLTRIEAGAFSGVGGLSEVILPYGMVEIGSRAFADSPLERIYIPETVTIIADDAFDGTVYPEILAPQGSYAQQFAEAHGLTWLDAEDTYTQASVEAGIALLEDNDSQQPIDQAVSTLALLSEETAAAIFDMSDPASAEKVRQINQDIADLAAEDQAYAASLAALVDSWQAMTEEVGSAAFSVEGDAVSLQYGSMSLTLSPESYTALAEEWELKTVAKSGDAVQYGISAGGQHYYLTLEGGSSLSLTAEPKLAEAKAVDTLGAEDAAAILIEKDILLASLQTIKETFFSIKGVIDNFLTVFNSAFIDAEKSYQRALRIYTNFQAAGGADTSEGRAAQKAVNERSLRLSGLRMIQNKLAPINGVMAGWNIAQNFNDFMVYQEIRGHGHPTAADQQDPDIVEQTKSLGTSLNVIQGMILLDSAWALIDLFTLIGSLCSVASAAVPGVGWATAVAGLLTVQVLKAGMKALIKQITEKLILGVTKTAAAGDVSRCEAILHGYSYGQVSDCQSLKPLADVLVECGGKTAKTDKNGEFTIQANGTATYSRNGYETLEASLYASPVNNMVLLYPSARLAGTVTYRSTGQPAAGVTVHVDDDAVTTDAAGFYTVDTSLGAQELTVNRGQPNEQTVQITLSAHMTNLCNVELAQITTLRGTVTEEGTGTPLAGVTVTVGNRSAKTDSSGSYALEVAVDTITATFTLAGYEKKEITDTLTETCEYRLDVTLKKRDSNYVTFGHYEQDNDLTNGPEPIEWLVLEVQGDKALLISRYGLDAKPYNTSWTDVTWETCTLRSWMNGSFLNTAFTAREQAAILTTNVDNSYGQCFDWAACWNDPIFQTTGGNSTYDKVFLLSYAEANRYFGVQYYEISGATDNMRSRISPTAYARAQGAWQSNGYFTADGAGSGWVWLRSPGFLQSSAAYVSYDGSLNVGYVSTSSGCVRPALWINLDSGIF